jgi:hypothetical protein
LGLKIHISPRVVAVNQIIFFAKTERDQGDDPASSVQRARLVRWLILPVDDDTWWWYWAVPLVPFSSTTGMDTGGGTLCFCCIHLIRVSWQGRVTPFWNVCLACFLMKPTISLKRYSSYPAFESMR